MLIQQDTALRSSHIDVRGSSSVAFYLETETSSEDYGQKDPLGDSVRPSRVGYQRMIYDSHESRKHFWIVDCPAANWPQTRSSQDRLHGNGHGDLSCEMGWRDLDGKDETTVTTAYEEEAEQDICVDLCESQRGRMRMRLHHLPGIKDDSYRMHSDGSADES